ncbi:MAG: gamma carbonic anhydrase family protein [Methanomicrobiales archaeon]|nr:gamma carbonic anhydrase family protein [Methanomicrobiales archaeon]
MDTDGGAARPLFVAPGAIVTGDVILDEEVNIWYGAVIRGDRDRISIGRGTNIQDNAVVHTSRGYPVGVGAYVSVGHGAILHGCRIADRVLVGMGAIVMNGASIGPGSIVGAGAVVTEKTTIPENSVVLGVPGRVVRSTTAEESAHIMRNAQGYIELARGYLHG